MAQGQQVLCNDMLAQTYSSVSTCTIVETCMSTVLVAVHTTVLHAQLFGSSTEGCIFSIRDETATCLEIKSTPRNDAWRNNLEIMPQEIMPQEIMPQEIMPQKTLTQEIMPQGSRHGISRLEHWPRAHLGLEGLAQGAHVGVQRSVRLRSGPGQGELSKK